MVIIPALNEAATIGAVVAAVPSDWVDDVIVVDNGSSDQTAAIAARAGARVIHEPRRGYGAACFAGAQAALGTVLVFLDGDGADDPADIPALLHPILADQADLVLGSRTRGVHEPGALLAHARLGNRLVAGLMAGLYDLHITDLGPFRAIRRELYDALGMRELTYGWTTEMMVKAARRDARIAEVPVVYRRRAGGRSKISGTVRGSFLAALSILGTALRYARWQADGD